MWSATRITADAAEKMQTNAGLLLNKFDVTNPVEPADADIVTETTGDFSISCVPTTEDFFADVNNAPTNTKEGKRITGWECSLGVTALSITEETLKLALGASEENENGGITPRRQYKAEDFKSLYWIGDMIDEDKLLVVAMDNTVSTAGLSFTATNNGKGGLALTLMPHTSLSDQTKIPMAFYILTKVETKDE
jgi:hypothetical protein